MEKPLNARSVRRGIRQDSRVVKDNVEAEGEKLELVKSFCYLGDMIKAGRGVKALTTRIQYAWEKF